MEDGTEMARTLADVTNHQSANATRFLFFHKSCSNAKRPRDRSAIFGPKKPFQTCERRSCSTKTNATLDGLLVITLLHRYLTSK